ncbi:hemagglutinin/amebocyte aggregation factor-like [Crassostrea virginica]|uniref:Hemagglutinin/amebocyte aggregation factor-like n=1 Tax=Crassostrea virginica TaxID=6565 RepID=A0A8B8AXD4_CRAVI|nr:hemagglutinin/amebocyte aggregation factor-like [Crassostrea virginica]
MKTLFLALVAILSLEISAAWKNDWDQPLAFKCPSSNSQISQIVSIHDNNKEDRLFDFGCRLVDGLVSGPISCRISEYVNNFDEPVLYACPNGGYLNGVYSVHDNVPEDRKFKFRCCTPMSGYYHKNCMWTDWANNWDRRLDYSVPSGYVIMGVKSIHDNDKQDRRFKFGICQIAKH